MSTTLEKLRFLALFLTFTAFAAVMPAHAATIVWANWSSDTVGNPGTGTGTIALSPSVSVSYVGQTNGLSANYPSWAPGSSYAGGSLDNAPPAANNAIGITGGSGLVNSLTFSSPVIDPVMAIWSLGQTNNPASFVFTASEPFTLEAGGPSAEYGGSSLTLSGNTVSGVEGNGVIQFTGTFSSLSWTNPVFENDYVITVGVPSIATTAPEPASWVLFTFGFAALCLFRFPVRVPALRRC